MINVSTVTISSSTQVRKKTLPPALLLLLPFRLVDVFDFDMIDRCDLMIFDVAGCGCDNRGCVVVPILVPLLVVPFEMTMEDV
jgi:hypothetical protein